MSVFKRVRKSISELIGSTRRIIQLWSNRVWSFRPSFDWNRVDYEFYDKLWRGQAEGLEKSGLLVKPLVSKITAWSVGRAPELIVEDDEDLQQEVNTWWSAVHASIVRATEESGKLGDCYLVMNGDGTLSVLPPDIVYPIVDEEDYSQIIGWRVNAVHPHPENATQMAIIDEYYADRRVRMIKRNGALVDEQTWPNPLGRIAVVHVPNGQGVNDRFGRPEAEPLINLLHDYGQILDAGLDGNYKQGRPVYQLEFDTLAALDKFWDTYGTTETQTRTDGTTETNTYLDLDLEGIVTFANAKGSFAAPGSSSGDTQVYLNILYYLFVEHTELPEFLLGSAIQGSRASADTQMEPFVKFIEKRQLLSEGWVKEVVMLAVAYLQTTMMRRRNRSESVVRVVWPRLTDEDNRLTLDTLKWAYASGLIDEENAIRLMPLEIDDPDGMLAKLRAGQANEGDRFDAAMQQEAEMVTVQSTAIQLYGENGVNGNGRVPELTY